MAGKLIKVNCKFCGTLFDSPSETDAVCPQCSLRLDEYVIQIKEYMEEYPRVTAMEINRDLHIPLPVIMHLIDDDFFALPPLAEDIYKGPRCAVCNEPIKRGKYCEKHLLSAIASETTRVRLKPTEIKKPSAKFHTKNNRPPSQR